MGVVFCNVVPCVAVCCSVLQRVAVCCRVLQCLAELTFETFCRTLSARNCCIAWRDLGAGVLQCALQCVLQCVEEHLLRLLLQCLV